jgi:hypothetical protein
VECENTDLEIPGDMEVLKHHVKRRLLFGTGFEPNAKEREQ